MNLKKEFAYIDKHFSNISKKELYEDLILCGLGKLLPAEASGYSRISAALCYQTDEHDTISITNENKYYSFSLNFQEAA